MDSTQITLMVFGTLAVTVIALVLVFVVSFLAIRRLARGVITDMETRYPNARLLVRNASFFGQQSKGVGLRGSGTMVITDKELVFSMWMPRREYVIPLKLITGIETPSSFQGKSRFTPLLKVNFTNDSGQPDAIAWQVNDLEGVRRLLESAM